MSCSPQSFGLPLKVKGLTKCWGKGEESFSRSSEHTKSEQNIDNTNEHFDRDLDGSTGIYMRYVGD